jgi:hypothetical protein
MKMLKRLEEIAKRHLRVETLETRNSDSLDFHDMAIWGIRDALVSAYMAGFTAGAEATGEQANDPKRK